jgi:hypothetical protein
MNHFVIDAILQKVAFEKCERKVIVGCVIHKLCDVVEKLLCPKDPSSIKCAIMMQ